jgi:hypothetical protein
VALTRLQELLGRDLTEVDEDELLAGIRAAELVLGEAAGWSGRLVRESRRREIPWSRMESATGKSKGTLDRRARSLP